MKKILFVFGTRPEAIKMAPVIDYLKNNPRLSYEVCVTAQHREMLDQVLHLFNIKPEYDLNIMKPNQDLFDVTSNILIKLKSVLELSMPDIILVHGDTTTTFTAALAAFYLKIPVGHVEAGLRTNNIYAPFPEEANRQLTSKIGTFHFPPTEQAFDNLKSEKIPLENMIVTGNTVIDALMFTKDQIVKQNKYTLLDKHIYTCGYSIIEDRKIILVTGHRRENFGEGFINIAKALKVLAINNPELDIVYPLHLNPNVQNVVRDYLQDIENIYLITPLDYEPFIYLMMRSYIILTDSGGIQEEAPSLGKPVLVMRDATERPEAVKAGTVKLVGTNKQLIVESTQELIDKPDAYKKMARIENPYGDGKASEKIIGFIEENLYGTN